LLIYAKEIRIINYNSITTRNEDIPFLTLNNYPVIFSESMEKQKLHVSIRIFESITQYIEVFSKRTLIMNTIYMEVFSKRPLIMND
jgi:hypothetical protein